MTDDQKLTPDQIVKAAKYGSVYAEVTLEIESLRQQIADVIEYNRERMKQLAARKKRIMKLAEENSIEQSAILAIAANVEAGILEVKQQDGDFYDSDEWWTDDER